MNILFLPVFQHQGFNCKRDLVSEKLSENLKRAEIEIMPGSKCKKEMRKISDELQKNGGKNPQYDKVFNGAHMLCGLGGRKNGTRVDSCQGEPASF